MKKKIILGIILIPIILVILFLVINNINSKYKRYIINSSEWNNIINTRTSSNELKINNLKFNDYNLIIDEDSSIIYYSVYDIINIGNPNIKYSLDSGLKIAFSNELDINNDIKVIVYNNTNYHIYELSITNYSIISINYKPNDKITGKRINVEVSIYNNNPKAINHYTKSDGKLIELDKENEYLLSLYKSSIGRNNRENDISIFDMKKGNEYLLTKDNNFNHKIQNVILFINNKYMGIYTINHKGGSDLRYENER